MVIVLRVGKLTLGKPFISAFDSTLSSWQKLQNIQYTWKQNGYQFCVLLSQQQYYSEFSKRVTGAIWFLFGIFLAFVVLVLQQYLDAQCKIKAPLQKTVKVCSLKRSNNGGRINKTTERRSDMPVSDRAGTAVWCSWLQPPIY